MRLLLDTHTLLWYALNDLLPFQPNHRGPFDRMLIAQAMVEQMQVVSIDSAFDAYAVTRIW